MGPTSARYLIRIDGHLGATLLSAFPALAWERQGPDTVLTGVLDQPGLYGVLAEIEALGLDLLEVRRLTPEADHRNLVMPSHRPVGKPQEVLIGTRRTTEAAMTGRVTILAGAGGELARATAGKLAAAGCTVIGIDRDEDGLKRLPDGVAYRVADPTDPVTAKNVVERIAAEVGPPDVLVNTVGTYHLGAAMDATPEDLRLMVDVNVGTALWLTQAVTPYMRDRGSGAIVHVAARPGLQPTAGMAAYGVSKAALVHLTRVLDLELRPLGIRVNAVAPRLIDTAKTRPYLPADLLAHAASPEAVADIIAYLVSDAATLVSGAVVPAYGA